MIEGRVKEIDLARRTAVITTQENQDLVLTFPEGMAIEVAEPETMGTMGGDLADLREGYYVEVEVGSKAENGTCACVSLLCVS